MRALVSLSSFLALTLLVSPALAPAGPETDDPARPTLGQTGQVFTLKFTPADRRIEVGIAGEPLAVLGQDRVLVTGRIFSENDANGKDLAIGYDKNAFQILNALAPDSHLEIEVIDRRNSKREVFKINQKPLR